MASKVVGVEANESRWIMGFANHLWGAMILRIRLFIGRSKRRAAKPGMHVTQITNPRLALDLICVSMQL